MREWGSRSTPSTSTPSPAHGGGAPGAAGRALKTLDGQERALGPDMALVCDPEHAVGIGGVMGGADSEVTAATTRVLLEAAYWDPGSIRRTARALR